MTKWATCAASDDGGAERTFLHCIERHRATKRQGDFSRHLPLILMVAVAVVSLTTPSLAQTKRETEEFIFQNSSVNHQIYGNTTTTDQPDPDSSLSIQDDSCVVRLDFRWKSGGTWGPVTEEWSATIDFNKIIASSMTITDDNPYLKIEISADPGAKLYKSHGTRKYNSYSQNNMVDVTNTEVDKIDIRVTKSKSTRVINALRYFVSNFCSGKRSAF